MALYDNLKLDYLNTVIYFGMVCFVMAVSKDVYSDVYSRRDCRHIYLQFDIIGLQSQQL